VNRPAGGAGGAWASTSGGDEPFEFNQRASKNQNEVDEVKTFFLRFSTTDQRRFF
jgi:hypothetical protein